MNFDQIRSDTAEALGVSVDKLDYLTDEFLSDLESHEEDEDLDEDADGVKAVGKWGRYANRVTFAGDKVHYYRGPRPSEGGSSDYGCGNLKKWAYKSTAIYIKTVGSCGSNGAKKLLSNYRA